MIRALIVSLLLVSLARAETPADLVIRHANILTLSERKPNAQSLAVRAGKFVAVGSAAEIEPFIGPTTRILDLDGKTIVPGFIDAHCHPSPIYPAGTLWHTVPLTPEQVRTIDDLLAALKQQATKMPKGMWVNGQGYQETKLGRHPTRHDLDRVSTEHPIMIGHSSGHLSVCNTKALQLAGITPQTKDPSGGQFGRDAQGELTGMLRESAQGIVRRAGPDRPDAPADVKIAAYRECFRYFLRHGITSVHAAGVERSTAERFTKVRAGEEPLRLYVMLRGADEIEELSRRRRENRLGDEGVRYGAIKLFHGNSLSGQTCWLYEPYAHRKEYFGVPPSMSQRTLNGVILKIHEAGFQACVHSNGDREIDMVLNAFENALKQSPRANHRHRIEHCSVVNESILKRIRELGLVIAPHSYIYEHGDKMENYGAFRWDWMHPNRSLIDMGVPVAANSDWPVSAARPLLRIQDMVLRTSAEGKVYGPKQRTTVEQALRAWTLGGAFASFEEKIKGSIEVGKLADFVVLSADLTQVEPARIKDIVVEQTIIGGRIVYTHHK